MDPFFLDAVVKELRIALTGAVANRIFQPGPAEVVLRFWNGRNNLRLMIGLAPEAARLHLTRKRLPNPQAPPRFAQLLRSRLRRLTGIERLPGERMLRFEFSGDGGERWVLLADMRGRRGDLVLLDREGRVVDSLLRRREKGRDKAPGTMYGPPEPSGRFSLEEGVPCPPGEGSFHRWLMASVAPMSDLAAADLEAAERAGIARRESLERLRRRWLDEEFQPCTGRWRGKPVLCPWPPDFLDLEDLVLFATPSEAAEAFYEGAAGEAVFEAGPAELNRVVRKGLRRLQRRLVNIDSERSEALGSERQRELADLLLANLFRLRKGMTAIVLEDWYGEPPEEVTIELDPALSPQENIEARFRRHKKGKRALAHTERRRRETEIEIEWLEGVALALEQATEPVEVQEIRRELQTEGLLRQRPAARKRSAPDAAPAVRRAATPGGFAIYWGRNNRANDHVSRQLTSADDLWFHAHGMPGCHLVLKRPGRSEPVPEADILFAAAIAAGHSKGRDDARVEVMVAEGKRVRKPKGGRPGMVTVDRFRTVAVAPLVIPSDAAD